MKLLVLAAVVAVAASQSLAPIPGYDTMSSGFDMIAGVQNNSWTGDALLPVFGLTYTSGKTWTYKTSSVDLQYAVPDQLTIHTLDESVEIVNDAMCDTYTDFISIVSKSFSLSAGVSININNTKALSLNGKFSRESYKYQNQMKTSDVASGFSRKWWALYSLESNPYPIMPLASGFESFLNYIPAKISSAADQKKYNLLVQYYGTHVGFKADFGGDVHMSTFVDKTILASHSQSWVDTQFSLTFSFYLFNLGTSGFKNQSDIHISTEFKEASHSYIFFKGGDEALQSNVTVQQWIESIPSNSVYLNVSLIDLATIVGASTVPEASEKGATLHSVLQAYMKTGKLPATDDSIEDYDAYYAQYADVPVVTPEMAQRYLRAQRNRVGA